MTDENRRRFEAFMLWSRSNKGAKRREALLDRLPSGGYVNDHVDRHFRTWNEAQAPSPPWLEPKSADPVVQCVNDTEGNEKCS